MHSAVLDPFDRSSGTEKRALEERCYDKRRTSANGSRQDDSSCDDAATCSVCGTPMQILMRIWQGLPSRMCQYFYRRYVRRGAVA